MLSLLSQFRCAVVLGRELPWVCLLDDEFAVESSDGIVNQAGG